MSPTDPAATPALLPPALGATSTPDVVVTTLGTCRIADPVAAAARTFPIRRNTAGVYGFVHTAKEVLQLMDHLDGRVIPPELVRFVASADYAPPGPRGPSDLFIVEVSSLKEVCFDGHLLQINCLDRAFQGRRELLDTLFQHKYPADRAMRRERLERLPGFAAADPLEQRILAEATVHITTKEELDQDLTLIQSRLPGPVVFACHIDLPDASGQTREARSRLCAWMRELCAIPGRTLFDPAPGVLEYGRTRALAEEGRDTNHYTAEYKSVLGAALFDAYMQPGAHGALAKPPAATAPVPAGDGHADLRATLADVKARIGRGETDEAEVLLRTASIDHPGAVEVYTLLGTVAYHRGDSTGALADLRHAMRLDPAAVEPKIMLVKIAQRLNRLEEACAQAQDLVASVPNDHKALTVAAKAFTKAKRFQQAAGIWRRVAMLREHQAAPLTEAARCELKGRNYEDAIRVADAALAREPDEAMALVIKAEALQRLKRMKEMAAVALLIAVADPAAAMAAVSPLVASSHHEEAASVLAAVRAQGHAAASDPVLQAGLVRSLTQRARRSAERGDAVASAAAWQAVGLLDPGNHRAASGLRKLVSPLVADARRHATGGDHPAAAAACRRGLGFEPGNVRLLRLLASCQERTADWPGAAQSWEKLATLSDEPTDALLRAARSAGRADRPDEALRLYARLDAAALAGVGSRVGSLARKLVRSMRDDHAAGQVGEAVRKANLLTSLDPGNAAAASLLRKAVSGYRRLLKVAIAAGDQAQQEEYCRLVLDIDPSRTDALKVLSRIYGGARRWRECIAVQQRLADLQPDEPRHWRKLASMGRAARRYDVGVSAALKAVELEPANTQSLEFLSEILNRQALAA